MTMFKDMLKSDESLFRDPVPLDYDFIPKIVPFREKEQNHVASCIKPLFAERNGKNLLIHGPTGVGKTVGIKHLFKELEDETEQVVPIYMNCWQKNTSFKIVVDMCEQLGYSFTHNKKTEELFAVVKNMLNKKGISVVFCFDEIDKVEDFDFLYSILEEIYRKTIILITNYKEWLLTLDERIKSRLTLETLEYRKYNEAETKGILKQRMEFAFVPNVWENDAFELCAKKCYEVGDVRTGLHIMKEAGEAAENDASKKVLVKHVEHAINKLSEATIKKSTDLEDETRFILKIAKEHPNSRIGDLFRLYQEQGGGLVYKSFQRKISKLEENKFITTKKIMGGSEGTTTIIEYKGPGKDEPKKLSDF